MPVQLTLGKLQKTMVKFFLHTRNTHLDYNFQPSEQIQIPSLFRMKLIALVSVRSLLNPHDPI